jgi:hypothetical protein
MWQVTAASIYLPVETNSPLSTQQHMPFHHAQLCMCRPCGHSHVAVGAHHHHTCTKLVRTPAMQLQGQVTPVLLHVLQAQPKWPTAPTLRSLISSQMTTSGFMFWTAPSSFSCCSSLRGTITRLLLPTHVCGTAPSPAISLLHPARHDVSQMCPVEQVVCCCSRGMYLCAQQPTACA